MASDRGTPRQGTNPGVSKQTSVTSVGSQGTPTTPSQAPVIPQHGYGAAPYGMYQANMGMPMHPQMNQMSQTNQILVHSTLRQQYLVTQNCITDLIGQFT